MEHPFLMFLDHTQRRTTLTARCLTARCLTARCLTLRIRIYWFVYLFIYTYIYLCVCIWLCFQWYRLYLVSN